MHKHAVDGLHPRPFPGSRSGLVVGPKASDNRGCEKHQVGGWSHPSFFFLKQTTSDRVVLKLIGESSRNSWSIWGFFFYSCWMYHLIVTATPYERRGPNGFAE
jgi:hypothetical protein